MDAWRLLSLCTHTSGDAESAALREARSVRTTSRRQTPILANKRGLSFFGNNGDYHLASSLDLLFLGLSPGEMISVAEQALSRGPTCKRSFRFTPALARRHDKIRTA